MLYLFFWLIDAHHESLACNAKKKKIKLGSGETRTAFKETGALKQRLILVRQAAW